ncbi:MAG: hypothetical protein ACI37S_08875 [Candidatus Gastranaerophilaceae bacterium]
MTINPIGVQTPKVSPNFTGGEQLIEKVASSKFVEKLVSSNSFGKVAEIAGKNPAVFNAASSLIMAGVLRPAAIMALPAKDEQAQKNKGNAAAHAIASGVIGFLITSIVMKPINAGLKELTGNVAKYMPNISKQMTENPAYKEKVEAALKFAPDIILAVPRALLTSKLAHIVGDKLFNKKKTVTEQPQQKQVEPQAQVAQAQATDRPVLDGFKGGNN